MKFDVAKLELSNSDIRRKIKIPTEMTKELAYDLGIMVGDGSINIYDSDGIKRSMIKISTHMNEDKFFRKSVLISLKKRLFNIFPISIDYPESNENQLVINSKCILQFYSKVVGLPLGSKNDISIPKVVKNSAFVCDFLRGLADSDSSLTFKKKYKKIHYYPVIKLTLKSKKLIQQTESILKNLGLKLYTQYDEKRKVEGSNRICIEHTIFISGVKNLKLWMKLIGFYNHKHLTKYQVWKKYGFCPPYTTIDKRLEMLKASSET